MKNFIIILRCSFLPHQLPWQKIFHHPEENRGGVRDGGKKVKKAQAENFFDTTKIYLRKEEDEKRKTLDDEAYKVNRRKES